MSAGYPYWCHNTTTVWNTYSTTTFTATTASSCQNCGWSIGNHPPAWTNYEVTYSPKHNLTRAELAALRQSARMAAFGLDPLAQPSARVISANFVRKPARRARSRLDGWPSLNEKRMAWKIAA